MNNKLTQRMIDYGKTHIHKRTSAWRDKRYKTGRKGISRNHTLADSSVSAILHSAFMTMTNYLWPSESQIGAVRNLFIALSGEDDIGESNANSFKHFEDAVIAGRTDKGLDHLIHAINLSSMGMGNLRFGEADTNTAIGSAFDPNLFGGKPTPKTLSIRRAVKGLEEQSLISHEMTVLTTTPAIGLFQSRSQRSTSRQMQIETPTDISSNFKLNRYAR